MMKHFTLLSLALMLGCGVAAAQPRSASAPAKLLSIPTGLMAPVWSPDGSMIAATGDNYTGIVVANADGSSMRVLTDCAGAGYKMVWNGNNQIVGRTNIVENGRVLHEICSWDLSNGNRQVLVAKSRNAQAPTLQAAGLRSKSANIYEMMMNDPAKVSSKVSALSQFSGKMIINPALSPDGNRIAFQVPGQGMWTINADGTSLKSIGAGSHPAWLPDNETVVYTVVKDNGQTFTASTLLAVNVDNGKSVTLTSRTDMLPMTPAVSLDGTRVAFENAADNAIYVITLKY